MAGKSRLTKEVKCGICGHISKDSAALSAHLRREHQITTDEEKLNYVLKFDTENNYYCETGDGSLKEFKRAILSNLPFEEKCYNLSKDKYQFVKKLAGKFDKFRVLADYLFLDLGLTKETISKDIVDENKSNFSATSLEYFLKKTDGDVEKAKELQKKRQSTTKESPLVRLINKYGEDEGLRRWDLRNKKCSTNIDGFILRHGESKGLELYKKYSTQGKMGQQSKIAMSLFNQLLLETSIIKNESDIFMYATENGEFLVELNEQEKKEIGVNFFYTDFKYKNKVIEFNGDYWHKNPEIYESTPDNIKIWDYDKKRSEIIKSKGFELITIWEKDFIESPKKVIEYCIDFLATN